ncbi:MAG: hypothetical protein JNL70_18330 [Saprospiraceae bacterium]|nr:hypothetical protein [Saprospiraceae bacterium]
MAYTQVSTTQHDDIQLMIERFQKLNLPFEFNDKTSLAILIAKNKAYKASIEKKNATLEQADADTLDLKEKEADVVKARSSFRTQIGELYGKDSDEYVWAGGVRQSESIEKAKATRMENSKDNDDAKK